MNTNVVANFDQTVVDENGIVLAQFVAEYSNGLHNITLTLNTIDSYQQNKDKIVNAFDDFLASIQTSQSSIQTFINLQVSSTDNSTTSQDSLADSSSDSSADVQPSSLADSSSNSSSIASSANSTSDSSIDQTSSSSGGD
ncbi:hypothetical protein [Oenococcus oeni]|uniref:hypothetical protein n=1 Tax=Oenococcus oeni TaxID=1247 RepID=UPI000DBF1950|nr:hypothetical protein [Oenococcus oeni]AWW99647.1 hypothetical protein C5H79_09370 [Oenococcus oeni]